MQRQGSLQPFADGDLPENAESLIPPSLQKLREKSNQLKAELESPHPSHDGPGHTHHKHPGSSSRQSRGVHKVGGQKHAARAQHSPTSTNEIEGLSPADVAAKFFEMKQENASLREEMKKRQESYIRRTDGWTAENERLRKLLETVVCDKTGGDSDMEVIRQRHRKILEQVDGMRKHATILEQERQREMITQFREKMVEIESEFTKKKDTNTADKSHRQEFPIATRSVQHDEEWIKKSVALSKEMDKYQELSRKLQKEVDDLSNQNLKLKMYIKTHDDGRELLLRQLVTLKKDNTRLKAELQQSCASLPSRISPPPSPVPLDRAGQPSAEAEIKRLKTVIVRLRRLLDNERKNLIELRKAHLKELSARTEVEMFVRQALDAVKLEISQQALTDITTNRRRLEDEMFDIPAVERFNRSEQERVLKQLQSHQKMLEALADKMDFKSRTEETIDPEAKLEFGIDNDNATFDPDLDDLDLTQRK